MLRTSAPNLLMVWTKQLDLTLSHSSSELSAGSQLKFKLTDHILKFINFRSETHLAGPRG